MPTEVLADEKALREVRRDRTFAQMDSNGIDVLLLGYEANARYVSGAQRLWTAGTRPYGPGCVVVRSTGAIHLVSTWDEGIPEDIPHENLFGITWNPGNVLAWLEAIEGTMQARRIGTDSLTPRFAKLLARAFPDAELVDAEPAMQAARRIKAPEEIEAIRGAVSLAEQALSVAVAELRPGVRTRHLRAVFMEAMARSGVTTPATQEVARVYPHRGRTDADEVTGDDLVVFDVGVVAGGYIGEVARTWPVNATSFGSSVRDLNSRADRLWDLLLGACRPGAGCSELLHAYELAGEAIPSFPIAWGLGMGFDRPVVVQELPATAAQEQLEPGMVLAIVASVADGSHVLLRKEAVLVSPEGPVRLTTSPRWHPDAP